MKNLHTIPDNHFDGLTSVTTLHATDNRLTHIPTMRNMAKLQFLAIEGGKITQITASTFAGCDSLVTLRLSDNRIASGATLAPRQDYEQLH